MITKEDISNWFKELQHDICRQLEEADGKGKFITDPWQRQGGGGGLTRIMSGGKYNRKRRRKFFRSVGKNSRCCIKVNGTSLDDPPDFFATGVSIVVHPHSPMVPIIHMNVRYFEMSNGTWWFGGGIDLTPHYVDERCKIFSSLNSNQFATDIIPPTIQNSKNGLTITSI